ncbi:hypothetical protein RR48_02079 [Papilio machaon]|uniref:Uncharacterized protein n=1 Tax=Papilio machaon TaxID=76193 RepID=A0A0N0PBQ2_PAPMA|nr:hypothetical protein RR48_02079 [Papilio machaon]
MKVLVFLSMLMAAAFAANYGGPVPLHQSDAVPLQSSSSGNGLGIPCITPYECVPVCTIYCRAANQARCYENQCYCQRLNSCVISSQRDLKVLKINTHSEDGPPTGPKLVGAVTERSHATVIAAELRLLATVCGVPAPTANTWPACLHVYTDQHILILGD